MKNSPVVFRNAAGATLCAALAFTAAPALAAGPLYFVSPSAYPVATPIRPGQMLKLQVCAKMAWLNTLVGDGALWPGPPYPVNLKWEAKKWTWASPPKLPTRILLETPGGDRICSTPLNLEYADFPAQDVWQLSARVQYDKGFTSGPIVELVKLLPPEQHMHPSGSETLAPAPLAAPPAKRKARGV